MWYVYVDALDGVDAMHDAHVAVAVVHADEWTATIVVDGVMQRMV